MMIGYCRLFTRVLSVVCFVLSVTIASAQSRALEGTITDASGEPLIGATVLIKGTTIGSVTDFDGNFTLDASTGDVLVVSFTGYTIFFGICGLWYHANE